MKNERSDCAEARATGALPIATFILVYCFISIQMWAWLPSVELYSQNAKVNVDRIRTFTVQGWAFFTKSPRDDRILIYSFDERENKWKSAMRGPNLKPEYAFGLDRSSRISEFDSDLIMNAVSEENWIECDNVSAYAGCFQGVTPFNLPNPTQNNNLCGEISITKAPPVPWSYRGLREGMPGKVLYLDLSCPD
ncbi:MAG: SdpA family antimicrobial peptide system protein [Corynebacterium sp.]|uniref:SdpA family antimicrobial peptide system protein n=1 Tax=Corynebacterium sp. TaxID=1720 RepID=UPI0026DD6FB8|nr:SdpA family antimicrobial peptide system protein [Corynebacterium sp.]MDO5099396.1 SdpA family antimicrobial peptide system protein [Corynebacterium sp.]